MPIFYENFLKKTIPSNTYFEEELSTKLNIISIPKAIDNFEKGEKKDTLNPNLKISDIEEETVYVQNEDKTYCLVKVNDFLYSFSFIVSSKVNVSNAKALTFGIIKNPSLKIKELNGRTSMINYRDSSTKVNVGGSTIKKLWRIILAYFKINFPGQKLIYRSDLEDHEHAIVSNLNEFLKEKETTKEEIDKRIDEIIEKVKKAKKYGDIAKDSGDSSFYKKERDLYKEISKKEKKDMIKALNTFKKLIEINEPADKIFNKENIIKVLSDFERKEIMRTFLYTNITQRFYGISKTRELIFNISKNNIDNVLQQIKVQIAKDAVIDMKGTKIRVIVDSEIDKLLENIKKIVIDNTIDDNSKKEKLNDLVESFYADNIQTIDYEKNNRYVVMK